MGKHITESKFAEIVNALSEDLKPYGFFKKGTVFRFIRNENCGIVQFQKSTTTTEDRLRFTVNFGVVCGALINVKTDQLKEVRVIDAHIQDRLGMFLPGHPDQWWEITSETDSSRLADEVNKLVVFSAVPYILGLLDTEAIVSLWQSGRSPGLTEGQRLRYLNRLMSM